MDIGDPYPQAEGDPYAQDHVAILFEKNSRYRPKTGIFSGSRDHQPTINMRRLLFDWMVELSEEFKRGAEVTFLSWELFDNIAKVIKLDSQNLQTVAVTAFHIADKWYNGHNRSTLIKELVYICDDKITRADIISMESQILHAIGWEMPTHPFEFSSHYALTDGQRRIHEIISSALACTEVWLIHDPVTRASLCVDVARMYDRTIPIRPHLQLYVAQHGDLVLSAKIEVERVLPYLDNIRSKYEALTKQA